MSAPLAHAKPSLASRMAINKAHRVLTHDLLDDVLHARGAVAWQVREQWAQLGEQGWIDAMFHRPPSARSA